MPAISPKWGSATKSPRRSRLPAPRSGFLRRWPVPVLALGVLSTAGRLSTGVPVGIIDLAVLVLLYTVAAHRSRAVSLSDDEGKTWKWTRHLEKEETGSYHYPAVIQGRDGTIHVVYSYFVAGGKSMKHAAFNEAWVRQGDGKD